MSNLLEVKDLRVSFHTYAGEVQAVRGVSFTVKEGETLAIVGESGSGKTVTSKAIMGLIASPPGEIKKESQILYNGRDILKFNKKNWHDYRGKDAGMIFQDPMTSLNPTMKIGDQIAEGLIIHDKITKKEAKKKVMDILKKVSIPNPEERINQYPHEFSGGMRQRAVIAIALTCNPKLLIADEPTTALDVTIQAQILSLLKNIQTTEKTAIIMITHDLGVVAGIADKIAVMYAGQIVEHGTVVDIFKNPQHPYTYALLNAVPKLNVANKSQLMIIPGTPPDLIMPPKGCGFATRCKHCMDICRNLVPDYTQISESHKVMCWLQNPMSKELYGYDEVRSVFENE